MHGYEMIQELESRTGGIWRPSPGSIYPTLQLLEDEGLIEAEPVGGRKTYQLTEAGRAEAETAAQNPPWSQFSDDSMSQAQDFRDAAVGIFDALREGITNARARPVSPVYPQISQAIYKNVNRAISGQTSAEDAMKQAQSDIEKALATF